jgi:hypothetical protein
MLNIDCLGILNIPRGYAYKVGYFFSGSAFAFKVGQYCHTFFPPGAHRKAKFKTLSLG